MIYLRVFFAFHLCVCLPVSGNSSRERATQRRKPHSHVLFLPSPPPETLNAGAHTRTHIHTAHTRSQTVPTPPTPLHTHKTRTRRRRSPAWGSRPPSPQAGPPAARLTAASAPAPRRSQDGSGAAGRVRALGPQVPARPKVGLGPARPARRRGAGGRAGRSAACCRPRRGLPSRRPQPHLT